MPGKPAGALCPAQEKTSACHHTANNTGRDEERGFGEPDAEPGHGQGGDDAPDYETPAGDVC